MGKSSCVLGVAGEIDVFEDEQEIRCRMALRSRAPRDDL
jgi:hypothetical protein